MGHNTTLHVVVTHKNPIEVLSEPSEDGSAPDKYPKEEPPQNPSFLAPCESHFYVYCPSCKEVGPGKLRVRCQDCLGGAIQLNREPGSWTDLEPQTIKGQCDPCGKETFAQFYFKCGKGDKNVLPLPSIRTNSRQVSCLGCFHTASPVFVFSCPESHVTCMDCFKSYVQSNLDSRSFQLHDKFGYTLGCPVGCEDSLIEEIHHFRVLDSHQYGRYKRFGAEECLRAAGGVQCPQPGCGSGYMLEEGDDFNLGLMCKDCGFLFCKKCLQAYHSGPCDQCQNTAAEIPSALLTKLSSWDIASRKTILGSTKPCPGCRVPTEKNEGCNHMTCPRCSTGWCWICQDIWATSCSASHWFDF